MVFRVIVGIACQHVEYGPDIDLPDLLVVARQVAGQLNEVGVIEIQIVVVSEHSGGGLHVDTVPFDTNQLPIKAQDREVCVSGAVRGFRANQSGLRLGDARLPGHPCSRPRGHLPSMAPPKPVS